MWRIPTYSHTLQWKTNWWVTRVLTMCAWLDSIDLYISLTFLQNFAQHLRHPIIEINLNSITSAISTASLSGSSPATVTFPKGVVVPTISDTRYTHVASTPASPSLPKTVWGISYDNIVGMIPPTVFRTVGETGVLATWANRYVTISTIRSSSISSAPVIPEITAVPTEETIEPHFRPLFQSSPGQKYSP